MKRESLLVRWACTGSNFVSTVASESSGPQSEVPPAESKDLRLVCAPGLHTYQPNKQGAPSPDSSDLGSQSDHKMNSMESTMRFMIESAAVGVMQLPKARKSGSREPKSHLLRFWGMGHPITGREP